jgi:hypothetical protein
MAHAQPTHPELEGKRPPCFTEKQWKLHVRCEREMAVKGLYFFNRSGFCAECTPQYQRLACGVGRCQYPTVTFYYDEDESLSGLRAAEDQHDPVVVV